MKKLYNIILTQSVTEFNTKGYYDQRYIERYLNDIVIHHNKIFKTIYILHSYNVKVKDDYMTMYYYISFYIESQCDSEIDIEFKIDTKNLRLNRMSYAFYSTHRVTDDSDTLGFSRYKSSYRIPVPNNIIKRSHNNFCLIDIDEYMEKVNIVYDDTEIVFYDKIKSINETNILQHFMLEKRYPVKMGKTEITKVSYDEEDYCKIYSSTEFEYIDNYIPLEQDRCSYFKDLQTSISDYKVEQTEGKQYKLKDLYKEKFLYDLWKDIDSNKYKIFIYLMSYDEHIKYYNPFRMMELILKLGFKEIKEKSEKY